MTQYTLAQFVESTRQDESAHEFFQLESPRMLEVNLEGEVWTKAGSMVAYTGQVKFEREGILQQGLGNLFKKAVSGEGARLTKASGRGRVYLADAGKSVQILQLAGESLVVNGNDLLAFETGIRWDISMMRKVSAMLAGGLFNIRLEGAGLIAITTHFEPLTLLVRPGEPIRTDPNATVAWSGALQPEFRTDVSLKTFFGRGSGESIQMEFDGEGFVIIQPYEEIAFQSESSS